MSKSKKRQREQHLKLEERQKDLKEHKGLSKYQRKKLEQKGIDIDKAYGGTP